MDPLEISPETYEIARQYGEPLGIPAEEVLRKATEAFLLEPLTIKGAAQEAKVSPRTIANWLKLKPGLGHCKIGRIVRISRTDLFRWIISHKPSLSPLTPVLPVGSRGRKAKPKALPM